MDSTVAEWLNLVFRWIHVLAGVMWIGHLWFFNFVNGQVAKTYDADSKKKVVPELMPRALYWFRWGAAYTFISGILPLWIVYWAGNAMGSERMSSYASGGRALFIYSGGLFGTIMAANVWMRIWPNQRKIISGVSGKAPAPDAAVPAVAALRSKHNTYMSVPLIFFMVSNHFPTVYGSDSAWVWAIIFVVIGWGIAKFLYNKAATPAPGRF